MTAVAEYDESRNGYFINFTDHRGRPLRVRHDRHRDQHRRPQRRRAAPHDPAPARARAIRSATSSTRPRTWRSTRPAQGYPFADVRPRIDRDVANHVFNITYLVDDGPRIYVERIDITGNEKTRDFVIRRELEFAEGDPFNRSMVSRGKTNIEALGFFKQVNVDVDAGQRARPGGHHHRRGRAVDRRLRRHRRLLDPGRHPGRSVADRAQLPRPRPVSRASRSAPRSRARPSTSRSPSRASWASRSRPASTSITASRTRRRRTSTASTTTGGQLRVGAAADARPDGERLCRRRAEGRTTTICSMDTFAATTPAIVDDDQTFTKAWVGFGLTYNSLDDMKRPTAGPLRDLLDAVRRLGPQLHQDRGRARYFMPLFEDIGIVASVRGSAGVINNFNPARRSARSRSFSIRPNLVRGFQPRGVGPASRPAASISARRCTPASRPRSSSRSRSFRRPTASAARSGPMRPGSAACRRSRRPGVLDPRQRRQQPQGIGRCLAHLGRPVRPAARRRRLRPQQGDARTVRRSSSSRSRTSSRSSGMT